MCALFKLPGLTKSPEPGPTSVDQDFLTMRGDQLHVISLGIVFFYSTFFTAANFYFQNYTQAYITMVPIPLSVLFYYFFRWGGGWALVSKLGNMVVLYGAISMLELLDLPSSTGVLVFFIPVAVGAMITFQGKQRVFAWLGVGLALILLAILSATDIQVFSPAPMSASKLVQERVQNYVGAALATAIEVGFLLWVSNELQKQLLANEQEKQRLAASLAIRSQEKQRNQVAVELHENINQVLASAKLNLKILPAAADNKEKIQETADHIEYALAQIRKLYHTLVTPDLKDFELSDFIRQMANELFADSDVVLEFEMKSDPDTNLSDEIKLSLYRIAQEHLQNVQQHACAEKVCIRLHQERNALQFIVEDDGVGFNTNDAYAGTGIRSMENRVRLHNGKMEFISTPGSGCVLRVHFTA